MRYTVHVCSKRHTVRPGIWFTIRILTKKIYRTKCILYKKEYAFFKTKIFRTKNLISCKIKELKEDIHNDALSK